MSKREQQRREAATLVAATLANFSTACVAGALFSE